jgi:hypothetical protein
MSNSNFIDGPLPILFSCRIRLNDEQRATLKQAYQRAKAGIEPKTGNRIGGSQVATVTQYNVDTQLGFPSVVVADILASRDSIAAPVLIKLQKTLGVTVVDAKTLTAAAKGYIDYILSEQD